jgi:hypothetical protein
MRPTGSIPRILTASLLLSAARAAADGPYFSSSASAIWQDNVTNATPGDGVLGAFTLETGVDLRWLQSIDFSTILSSGLTATADCCTTFGGLDSFAFGPRVELRHKAGLGPLAPTLTIGLEADGVLFGDSYRSNLNVAVEAGFSQRFGDNLQLVLDGRVGAYAARSDVFSGEFTSMGATLNWDLDETWRFKAIGGWRDGDIVADYAAENSPYGWVPIDMGAYNYTGPWQSVRTFSEPFIAYRGRAQTWSCGAGVSPALGRHTSLVLELVRYDTGAYDRYVDNVVSASVVHRF